LIRALISWREDREDSAHLRVNRGAKGEKYHYNQ
jgi:hypothetical protein